MYVIKRQSGTVTMWLKTITPRRWGEIETAMRFQTRGEARRAAVAIKLSGDWSVDEVSTPVTVKRSVSLT
jgi:hypothetical protein